MEELQRLDQAEAGAVDTICGQDSRVKSSTSKNKGSRERRPLAERAVVKQEDVETQNSVRSKAFAEAQMRMKDLLVIRLESEKGKKKPREEQRRTKRIRKGRMLTSMKMTSKSVAQGSARA